jgi:hypothetical protein
MHVEQHSTAEVSISHRIAIFVAVSITLAIAFLLLIGV